MRTQFKTSLLWIPVLFLHAAGGLAQNTGFTYQGRLNDGAVPATGTYDLSFALYDASSNGAQQGSTSIVTAVGVTNGLFTVTLDFGNQFPGANRWLEIGVRTNGGGVFWTLVPRQQLASVPYSVQAANAATATTAASAGSVAAANISGTIATTQLPANVVTNGASGVSLVGSFAGNGGGMTNVTVPLSSVNSGGLIIWPGVFAYGSSPGVGSAPFGIVAADVNGDGKVDLVSANIGDNTLSVLTNNGLGSFALACSPGVGGGPYAVVAADVNGDGKVDLISANNYNNTLTVLTNDGFGNFAISSSPGVGNGPASVAAADVNGDGKVDLISANSNTNTLTVLTNDGFGNFAISSSLSVGNGPTSVTAADVNGDGNVDLISANYNDNTLTVLTNDGHGGFNISSSPGVGSGPYTVVAADVNGDGKVDLISANNNNNTLTVLTNNGLGGFGIASSPGADGGPARLVAADVNGDGKVDLIASSHYAHPLTVLTNDGVGGFALASAPGVGVQPESVAAADLNGDGKVDLISANLYGSTLTILFNTPTVSGFFSGNGAGLTNLNASQLITGTLPASALAGADGSGLTSLNASQLTSGTVADARLSSNVALRAGGNSFSGNQTVTSGNVGIGTLNPVSKLNVVGDGGIVQLQAVTAGSASYQAFWNSSGTLEGLIGVDGNGFSGTQNQFSIGTWTSHPIGLFTGSNQRLTIGANGNVGIATTSPARLLQVGSLTSTTDALIRLACGNGSTLRAWDIGVPYGTNNATGDYYSFTIRDTTSSADRMVIRWDTGNVGFGTASPGNNVQVGSQYFSAAGYGLQVNSPAYGADIQISNSFGIALFLHNAAGGNPNMLRINNGPSDTNVFNITGNGAVYAAGAVSALAFNPTSDRNAKENFQPVSSADVLAKVMSLPVQEWNFKADAGTRHIGPMAQDFYAAFGVGPDDRHISTVDADGVALAAIQGLNQKLENAETRSSQLERRLAEKESEISELTKALNELKELVTKMGRQPNDGNK